MIIYFFEFDDHLLCRVTLVAANFESTVYGAVSISERKLGITRFFIGNAFFSTQPQRCLSFSWIELQIVLRGCLIHVTIIMPRHILYLVYVCLCLGLGLFVLYLYDLFFISSLIFIVINHINSFKQTCLFFVHFLEYLLLSWMVTWMKKMNNFQIAKVQPQGAA